MCAETSKKVKKIERRQKADWRAAGKDVSDVSEDEAYEDPFAAYEAARDVAAGEGPSHSFHEDSSTSSDDDDDGDELPDIESPRTNPEDAVDSAAEESDAEDSDAATEKAASGDESKQVPSDAAIEIVPSDEDED